MLRRLGLGLILLCACEANPDFDPSGGSNSGTGDSGEPLEDPCPPLPAPDGEVIMVTPAQATELPSIVQSAPADSTVVLASGSYPIDQGILFGASGVTVRSASGNPQDVVIDGQRLMSQVFFISQARTTVAEITVARPQEHCFHTSGSGTAAAPDVSVYRVRMVDPGSIAFKVNPSTQGHPADDGTLACSSITLTDEGRGQTLPGCAGGVAGFATRGWHIRDNSIEGIWCNDTLAGSAIRFAESSADNVIERNLVRDCAVGIFFGVHELQDPPSRVYTDVTCNDGYYDHYGGAIRNNMVVVSGTGIAASDAGVDAGIGLWQVCDAIVVHNTVAAAVDMFSGVEYRFTRTTATVVNNLVTDEIIDRNDAGVPVAGNLQEVDLNNFVDPLGGDVHLVPGSEAVDAGVMLGDNAVAHDIDGDPREGAPDVGADEI